MDAGIFFLNALQSYSVVKHLHGIDLNNFNVLEVCTVQLKIEVSDWDSVLADTQY